MKYLGALVGGAAMPLLLLLVGGYFTAVLGRYFLRAPRRGLSGMLRAGGGHGTTPARAVSMALAGTLGVGNIAGVAAAITVGGAGAVFWMWVAALVAMPLKYAEIVLAQLTRARDGEGRAHGGAMYYMKAAVGGGAGRAVAAVFAVLLILCTLTLGSLLQARAAAEAMGGVFGCPQMLVGAAMALLALPVLLGGARGVERVCARLVPFLCVAFTVAALAVLIVRRAAIPAALAAIFQDALTPAAGVGGLLGVLTSRAVRFGVARGLVSNEAGCGTAPIAHAAAEAQSPAQQGLWGIFEVFVDTVLLCTLTALVILVAGEGAVGDGVMLAISAFGAVLGPVAPPLIAFAVLLFAFATVLAWAHYGAEALSYLTGGKRGARLLAVAVAFATLLGAVTAPDFVWGATDLTLGAMTLLNLATLFHARRTVIRETKRFYGRE
ncbi:MAG: sodium:alanine symporter family protein [Clostridia bacterium]|nr:sodium:alanine symporter family protein [Clostridia bacterium]